MKKLLLLCCAAINFVHSNESESTLHKISGDPFVQKVSTAVHYTVPLAMSTLLASSYSNRYTQLAIGILGTAGGLKLAQDARINGGNYIIQELNNILYKTDSAIIKDGKEEHPYALYQRLRSAFGISEPLVKPDMHWDEVDTPRTHLMEAITKIQASSHKVQTAYSLKTQTLPSIAAGIATWYFSQDVNKALKVGLGFYTITNVGRALAGGLDYATTAIQFEEAQGAKQIKLSAYVKILGLERLEQ